MFQSSNGLELVRNLIRLGHDLGLDIIAEGVEEQQQIDKLYEYGCSIFQGYHFSPPLSPHQFENYVRQISEGTLQKRAC